MLDNKHLCSESSNAFPPAGVVFVDPFWLQTAPKA